MPDIGTRALVLYVDSVDFTSSVKDARITTGPDDSDFMSYAQALAGGARAYKLHLVLKQATDTTGLWYYIWSELGADQAIELWPNGYNGGVQSTTYPQFTGTATVMEPDGDLLGGEAKASVTAKQTVEVDWPFTAKPTLVTSPP